MSLRLKPAFLLPLLIAALAILFQLRSSPPTRTQAVGPPTLYGATTTHPIQQSNGPSFLYTIDPSTGAATLVGPIGFNAVGGIDFDPATGILYGIGSDETLDQFLITINPATGAGTIVGDTGLSLDEGQEIGDISFRNSDSTLFATTAFNDGAKLYTVNLSTGLATLVGPSGLVGGNGMAFSPADTLYHASFAGSTRGLYTQDQTNGSTTLVTAYGSPTGCNSNFARINAMDFQAVTGTLFAIEFCPTSTDYLVSVNPSTGAIGTIGLTQPDMDAIAALPPAISTPTPTSTPTRTSTPASTAVSGATSTPTATATQTPLATSTPVPLATVIIHLNQSGEVGGVISAARQAEINATARAGQAVAPAAPASAPVSVPPAVILPPNTGTGGLR